MTSFRLLLASQEEQVLGALKKTSIAGDVDKTSDEKMESVMIEIENMVYRSCWIDIERIVYYSSTFNRPIWLRIF